MRSIILNELRSLLRDKVTLFFLLFFPLLMIYMLGTFLQNIDVSDYEIGEIQLGVTVDAEDMAFDSFLKELTRTNDVVLHNDTELSQLLAQVNDSTLNAAVHMDENGEITLYTGTDATKNRAIRIMLESFLYINSTYTACITETGDFSVLSEIQSSERSFTEAKELGMQRTMIDYYAVAMLVMIMFMCSTISGAESFQKEDSQRTAARLVLSGASRTKIFLGKLIGTLPVIFLQIGVVMAFSVLFFDAHYAADLPDNLLLFAMLFTATLPLATLGMLLGIVTKVPPAAFFQPVCWTLLFFSGTFSKEIYIEGFSDICPPYLIQQAAFDLTLFSRPDGALIVIAVSLVCFVLFSALGIFLFSRKELSR